MPVFWKVPGKILQKCNLTFRFMRTIILLSFSEHTNKGFKLLEK